MALLRFATRSVDESATALSSRQFTRLIEAIYVVIGGTRCRVRGTETEKKREREGDIRAARVSVFLLRGEIAAALPLVPGTAPPDARNGRDSSQAGAGYVLYWIITSLSSAYCLGGSPRTLQRLSRSQRDYMELDV